MILIPNKNHVGCIGKYLSTAGVTFKRDANKFIVSTGSTEKDKIILSEAQNIYRDTTGKELVVKF